MVVVGFAVGFATVLLLRAVEGDHEYVLPPTAVAPILVEDPVQIAVLAPAEAAGNGFTVTVTE